MHTLTHLLRHAAHGEIASFLMAVGALIMLVGFAAIALTLANETAKAWIEPGAPSAPIPGESPSQAKWRARSELTGIVVTRGEKVERSVIIRTWCMIAFFLAACTSPWWVTIRDAAQAPPANQPDAPALTHEVDPSNAA